MLFLLDTNVVSEPSRPRPDARVVDWVARTPIDDLAVSSITVGEIQTGISLLAPGARREKLSRWLDEELPDQFGSRMLPVDVPVAREWGRIAARARNHGWGLSAGDGLLLATAAIHYLVLVTRNERDFQGRGVDVYNPWNA